MRVPALRVFGALAASVVSLVACDATVPEDGGEGEDLTAEDAVKVGASPDLCVGVRGNGHYIVTHFASMARIVETYGIPNGMAGGSSGSITQFVYESVLMNPGVRTCGTRACNKGQASARVALTLKSLEGYGEAVAGSDEVVAITELVGLVSKLKAETEKRNIEALLKTDVAAATRQLQEVLAIPEFSAIVNPEIKELLASPQRASFAAKDVQKSITTLGAFSVDDNRLFFRPGLLNWNALADLFGRVASFYAGYAPADVPGMKAWLDDCAEGSVGKPWTEAAAVSTPKGTCGERFVGLVNAYRKEVRAKPPTKSRIDDRVDLATPLMKLISTSVLEGEAAKAYKTARSEYLSGKYPDGNIAFAPPFADIKFGYWGRAADLEKVRGNPRGLDDLKTAKFSSLGGGSWREVLTASPAEPGLSRLVELPDGRVSAGGWSDLAPVLVLKNAGCQKVVYVTREGDESGFAVKIAKNLGMDKASWQKLYDLSGQSAYTRSVAEADGVWCTNWNGFTDLQQREMSLDSFRAPLEVRAGLRSTRALRRYANVTDKTGKVGCTPLVSGGATYPE